MDLSCSRSASSLSHIQDIDPSAFSNTPKLRGVGCKGETGHLAVPEGVAEIKPLEYFRCLGIASVSLPSTLKNISTLGFFGSSKLESNLTIPASVEMMGLRAFQNCDSLTSLGCLRPG